jgi:HEPN domain-containing protein
MEPETLDLAAQWVAKAEQDFLAVNKLTISEPIPWSVVCFHCQQVAEKYLKAYLVTQKIAFSKTHNLLHLLDLIKEPPILIANLREALIMLNDYAVESRYPDDWWEPSKEDGIEAVQQAQKIRDRFRKTDEGATLLLYLQRDDLYKKATDKPT